MVYYFVVTGVFVTMKPKYVNVPDINFLDAGARPERDAEAVVRAAFPRLSLGKDLTPRDPTRSEVHPLAEAPETAALGEALRELLGKRLPWLDER